MSQFLYLQIKTKNQMRINTVRNHFSHHRIDRYLIATSNNNRRAIRLYKHNLKISQSFYPILSVLEIILRNKLNEKLSTHFSDPNWIINQKRGFMIDPALSYNHPRTGRRVNNHFIKESVEKSENKLNRAGIPLSPGKIIADQSFSFWTELFELTYYRILLGRPIQIFQHLPSTTSRVDILNRLTKIRKFRNRISHYEPICFNGNTIDFTEAINVYNTIIELLNWIDPELVKFIKDLDQVNKKITSAMLV